MITKTLAPSGWPARDREHWLTLENQKMPGNPTARGMKGAVTTAHHALATRAGIEALNQGGSAVDAALTAALAQITLGAGAVISFAGISALMHFEAASGEVTSLQGGWKTCREETDPLSIPDGPNPAATDIKDFMAGTVSGRAAMVGGFMKALEAAHRRFGRLPFARLFEPAIELAENGFDVNEDLAEFIALRGDDLKRLAATRDIFCKPDGALYQAGDWFRQPALAKTLRAIAREGAAYLYTGPWAQACVEAVRADGGNMSLADRAGYEVIWSEPVRYCRGGRELALLGAPCAGSVNVVEALNLAEVAGIRARGHWTRSAQSFNDLALLCSAFVLSYIPPQHLPPPLNTMDWSPAARVTPEHARALWALLKDPAFPLKPAAKGTHSDDVVVVDSWGNAAALCHSSNSILWGKSAVVVDGISVHDPATHQKQAIAAVGPGAHLPMPVEVGLILNEGQCEIAFSSMAMGLHQKTVAALLNVLDFGMDVAAANNGPALCLPAMDLANPMMQTTRVIEGEFDAALLADTGLRILEVPREKAPWCEGQWIAIQRNRDSGELIATSPPNSAGQASAI